jgi:hypothetical protein
MHCRFLLAGPDGDYEPDPVFLGQPFLISPTEKHPFLSLGDYFNAIQTMLQQDNGRTLAAAFAVAHNWQSDPADIGTVVIRSEKHGAFYHIASVEVAGPAGPVKLAVTSALADEARNCLAREYEILADLTSRFTPEFLPQSYFLSRQPFSCEAGQAELLMVLGEWLAGYHEWHLSRNPATGGQAVQLWDYDQGYVFLSETETSELIRQVAFILTSYYDQDTFSQIYPWHHGAGDFVISRADGLKVKLITVRNYSPFLDLSMEDESSRLVGIINFLLNLTLRSRLDRLDGVGEPAWLDDFVVEPALQGFFAALSARPGTLEPFALLDILQAFDPEEMLAMYEPLLEIYSKEDRDDFAMLLDRLPDHVNILHREMQNLKLRM